MEYQISGGTQDHLLESLDFTLSKTANYVTSRRMVSYYTSGAGTFSSPSGVRVIRINLTGLGDCWLDPTTVRLQFTIHNVDTRDKYVLESFSGPHCFFDRVRLLAQGTVIEDVQQYHRTHEMLMEQLTPRLHRIGEGIEGFGTSITDSLLGAAGDQSLDPAIAVIPAGKKLTVLMRPCLGFILGCQKVIPLHHCPITFEFYLADPAETFQSGSYEIDVDGTKTKFERTNKYYLTNIQIKCDVMHLDSRVENSYASIMQSGKALTFSHPVYHTQYQAIPGDRPVIALTRALSRLRGLFVTFAAANSPVATTFDYPKQSGDDQPDRQRWDRPLSMMVQLGSKKFPEQPIASTAEFYEHLRKALHIHNNIYADLSLDLRQYEDNKFIIGVTTEKVLGSQAAFSGLNTKTGDQLILTFTGMYDGGPDQTVHMVYATHVADQVVTLTESGIGVYD